MALYLFILGNEAFESEILHMVTNPFLIRFVSSGAEVTMLWLGIREAEHTAALLRGLIALTPRGRREPGVVIYCTSVHGAGPKRRANVTLHYTG